MVPMALADNSTTTPDTYVDVNIDSDGNINFNADLDSEGDNYVYINGEIANPTYEVTQVTKRSTNRDGIFRTIVDLFQMYFGEDSTKNLDKEEIQSLQYLNKFRQSIIDEVYYTQVQPLQLELKAQKKINQRLTQELEWIHEANGWEVNQHGLECYGYIRVMLEDDLGIRSVTCQEGNESQKWFKQLDSAVMLRPIFNEPVNETNSTTPSTNETLPINTTITGNQSFNYTGEGVGFEVEVKGNVTANINITG